MTGPLYVVTERAERDIFDIGFYIAQKSPNAADRVVDRFVRIFELVSDNPLAGRARPELRSGVRSIPAGSYVVFYEPTEEGVIVLRVLHGARDIGIAFDEITETDAP